MSLIELSNQILIFHCSDKFEFFVVSVHARTKPIYNYDAMLHARPSG